MTNTEIDTSSIQEKEPTKSYRGPLRQIRECRLDCIDGYITSWVQQQYGGLEVSLPPGYAMDKRSTIKWAGQVLAGANRPRASASVDNLDGLIRDFWRIIRMRFSRTKRLKQRVKRYLDGHDGRPLHVPQAIKRNCRMAHEAQSADSQGGNDDD